MKEAINGEQAIPSRTWLNSEPNVDIGKNADNKETKDNKIIDRSRDSDTPVLFLRD
jgi:hypothetical protein